MRYSIGRVLIGAAIGALTACGGGGDSTPIPPASVPLAQAIKNVSVSGSQRTFNLTGTVSGSGQTVPVTGSLQYTQSGYNTPTTFNGQAALSSTVTLNGTLTGNGQTLPLSSTAQGFVASDYSPLGTQSPTEYCVVTGWTPLPASASIGATATYYTSSCYSDSTMATFTGRYTINYAVSVGTSSSNLAVTEIGIRMNANNVQQASMQLKYLVDTSGGVAIQSFALTETSNGITLNLTGQ